MLFSVIVPVYKAERYLRHCVDSLLQQSFRDFEVILVDDGSPDGCPAICDEYAARDPRVRVIHQKNCGALAARRAGVAAAAGVYLLSVDSDDEIDTELLETLAAAIKADPCDVIAFGAVTLPEDGMDPFSNSCPPGCYRGAMLARLKRRIIFDPDGGRLNYGTILYSLWSKAIRRELMVDAQSKVDGGITKGDDLAVTALILAQCESLQVLEFRGYHYRIHETSMMHTYSEKDIASAGLLLRHLSAALGDDYYQQLCGLAVNLVLEHCGGTARSGCSYRRWKTQLNAMLSSVTPGYIRDFAFRGSAADMMKIWCLKHCHFGLYGCFHIADLRRKAGSCCE